MSEVSTMRVVLAGNLGLNVLVNYTITPVRPILDMALLANWR